VQFAIVIGVILWLQNADDRSIFGQSLTASTNSSTLRCNCARQLLP
jgi:hypothetical protein